MVVDGQDMLGTAEGMTKVLALIPDDQLKQDVEKEMNKQGTSSSRWNALLSVVQNTLKRVCSLFDLSLCLEC